MLVQVASNAFVGVFRIQPAFYVTVVAPRVHVDREGIIVGVNRGPKLVRPGRTCSQTILKPSAARSKREAAGRIALCQSVGIFGIFGHII